MKGKIGFVMAVLLGTSQVFALDAKACMRLEGSFVEATKKENEDAKYEFFKLNKQNQVDDDALTVEFSGDRFGGRFALRYDVDSGTSGAGTAASMRRSNLWMKPVDNLKLTVGWVGNEQLYKEKIDWWKVGNPFRYDERDWGKHPGYINPADTDDMGFGIEYKPMDSLILTAAVARMIGGANNNFDTPFFKHDKDGENTYRAWGLSARYFWRDGIGFQAAYRDNGKESWKVARAGVGIERDNFMAFFQPCFGIDYDSTDDSYELSGISFDMYGEYTIDAFKVQAHFPVTVRLTGDDGDSSYMEWLVKASYNTGKIGNMDNFAPYIKVGSYICDGDQAHAFWRFDDLSNTMNFNIKPGVEFNVGGVDVDVAFNLVIHSDEHKDADKIAKAQWSIPFTTKFHF